MTSVVIKSPFTLTVPTLVERDHKPYVDYQVVVPSCNSTGTLVGHILQPLGPGSSRFAPNTVASARGLAFPAFGSQAQFALDTTYGALDRAVGEVAGATDVFFTITGTLHKRWFKDDKCLILNPNQVYLEGWYVG